MTIGKTLCVVGSANVDTVVRLSALPTPGETVLGEVAGRNPGGKGLNQAVAAARVGADIVMSAVLGADDDGALLRAVLEREGVDTRAVKTDRTVSTGRAHVYALPGAENSIVVAPGANLSMTAEVAQEAVEGAAVVLVQCEIPLAAVESALRFGKETGALTVLNVAPVLPGTSSVLQYADVVIANETEAAALGGPHTIADAGVATVIVTEGAAGTMVFRHGQSERVPPVRVVPIDTTGAGDAFCGVYAAARASGLDDITACLRGNAAGAIATTAWGAQGAPLSAEAVDLAIAHGTYPV